MTGEKEDAHPVFFVSDHTGVTAEAIGHSLLSRFEDVPMRFVTRPFIASLAQAEALAEELAAEPVEPLVFTTITDAAILERIRGARGIHLDLFAPFLPQLENVFDRKASGLVGAFHGIRDLQRYQARIDAVEFALATDDGTATRRYEAAEVILLGPSRVGKTPTCLYLAMQFGVAAANYPLADDDFASAALPPEVAPFRQWIFGLTIDPLRLQQLRSERKPGSAYASFERCDYEVRAAERLFRQRSIPFRNTTAVSVEELAAVIVQTAGLRRHR